ncbi:MAG: protoglobin domain-containing protein [Planctomycetota bacterium]
MRIYPKTTTAILGLSAVLASGCAGNPSAPQPPALRVAEFRTMQDTALFGTEDIQALQRSRPILEPRLDELLDVWYGFVASKPHLLASFSAPDGEVLPEYLAAVRKRFAAWVLATADANYDESWLRQQLEIGRRHHRTGKNRTDDADAVEHIPFRNLIPLCVPILTTLKPFLAEGADSAEDLEQMHAAWTKSVLLQVTLWSTPYIQPGDF